METTVKGLVDVVHSLHEEEEEEEEEEDEDEDEDEEEEEEVDGESHAVPISIARSLSHSRVAWTDVLSHEKGLL